MTFTTIVLRGATELEVFKSKSSRMIYDVCAQPGLIFWQHAQRGLSL